MTATDKKSRDIKLIAGVLLFVVAAGVGYYFLHFNKRQQYLVERNFRQLGAVAERMEASVNNMHTVLHNAAKAAIERRALRPQMVANLHLQKLWQTFVRSFASIVDSNRRWVNDAFTGSADRYRDFAYDTVLDSVKFRLRLADSLMQSAPWRAEQFRLATGSDALMKDDSERFVNAWLQDKGWQQQIDQLKAAIGEIDDKTNIQNALSVVPHLRFRRAHYDSLQSNEGKLRREASSSMLLNHDNSGAVLRYRSIPIDGAGTEKRVLEITADLALDSVLTPLAQAPVFRNVIVVQDSNLVLYQSDRGIGTIVRFDVLSDSESGSDKSFASIRHSSQIYDFNLAGADYKVFLRPLKLQLSAQSGGKTLQWLVAGLADVGSLTSESLAISYNVLLLFILAVLLLGLAWPLLNIWGISPRGRIRPTELMFLAMSSVLGTAVIAILLIDLYEMTLLKRTMDQQLDKFAAQISDNYHHEINRACEQLAYYCDSLSPHFSNLNALETGLEPVSISGRRYNSELQQSQRFVVKTSIPRGANLLNYSLEPEPEKIAFDPQPVGWSYPFFDRVFWADSSGAIRVKLTTGPITTPLINVARRDYFRNSWRGNLWTLPPQYHGRHSGHYYLSPHHSWTTGTYETTLATPYQNTAAQGKRWVAAMDIDNLLSLSQTVLPPDFGFAVIDNDGDVQYHSIRERSGFENFFVECDNDKRLRSSVAGRLQDFMSVPYWGEDRRVCVKPLEGTPWSIVVFYSQDKLFRTLNIETLSIAVTLFLINALIILFILAAAFILPRRKVDWAWPDVLKTGKYLILIALYSVLFLLFSYAMSPDNRADKLLLGALTVPVFLIMFTYLFLKKIRRHSLRTYTVLLGFVAYYPLLVCMQLSDHRHDYSGWKIALILGGILLLAATLHSLAELLWRRRRRSAGRPPVIGMRRRLLSISVLFYIGLYLFQWLKSPSWYGTGELIFHSVVMLLTILALKSYVNNKKERISVYRAKAVARARDDSFKRLYRWVVLLFLVVTSVLPAFVYFNLAYSTILELFIKNAQFELSVQLEERDRQIEQRYSKLKIGEKERAIAERRSSRLDQYQSIFFTTEQHRNYAHGHLDSNNERGSKLMSTIIKRLPLYNATSVKVRSINDTVAADNSWSSHYHGPVELHFTKTALDGHKRYLRSLAGKPDFASSRFQTIDVGLLLLLLVSMCFFLWLIYVLIGLISRRVFLVDIEAAPGTVLDKRRPHDFTEPLMIITQPDTRAADIYGKTELREFSMRSLLVQPDELAKIAPQPGELIVIGDFEYGFYDPAMTISKAEKLATLLQSEARIAVFSAIETDALIESLNEEFQRQQAEESEPDIKQEQVFMVQTVFSSLRTVFNYGAKGEDNYERELDALCDKEVLKPEFPMQTLAEECRISPHLQRIGYRLCRDRSIQRMEKQDLIEMIAEQAHPYFTTLWESCTQDEKLALADLAKDGLVNSQNKRAIQRLMRRRLIYKAPNLLLLNRSFRSFLLMDAQQQQAAIFEEKSESSFWRAARTPLIIVMVLLVGFLFFTQQQLLDSTAAFISAATVLMPALLKLFEFVRIGKGGD